MARTVNHTNPYEVIWRDGQPIDRRTASALRWAEKKSGVSTSVTQGSYKRRFGGGATASAGTHDLGGVIDVRSDHLTRRQRIRLVRAMKRAGFFVWYRDWPGNRHVHAGLRKHRNLAAGAAQQERDYDSRLKGLVSRLRDRTWRPLISRRWSHRRNRPILLGR